MASSLFVGFLIKKFIFLDGLKNYCIFSLTSISGIFANANLSILFLSHVEMFQLSKPLNIKDHKLIIPEDHKPKIPREIIAVENAQFERSIKTERDTLKDDDTISFNPDEEYNKKYSSDLHIPPDLMKEICDVAFENINGEPVRNTRKGNMKRVNTIADFGEFPTSMDMLEQCPNDKNHLCLNMLGDEVPGEFIQH